MSPLSHTELEAAYRLHADAVYRQARLIVGDADAAADVVHGQVVAAPAGCCWTQFKVDPASSALIVQVRDPSTPTPSPAARIPSSPMDSVLIGPTGLTRVVFRSPNAVLWDN